MGCAASSIDNEERVRVCKERKRSMKQLVGFRGEFADAQLSYLRSLKNTGVTLRQFTESESLELENGTFGPSLLSSPTSPLPPCPPPPPPFSPEHRKLENDPTEDIEQQESIKIDEDDSCTPPPPPVPESSWVSWNLLDHSMPPESVPSEALELDEEDNWAETETDFENEDRDEEVNGNLIMNQLPQKSVALVDNTLSMLSFNTKETADMAMVVRRSKITLEGIIKDLDDYFLRSSDGGKEIAILMDFSRWGNLFQHNVKENKKNSSNSARVFSVLSWSWSSKSLQFIRDSIEFGGSSEPCKPGAHRITLENLYAAENKLYKGVKEEEIAKLEYDRKSMLLQKQEDENYDWSKTDKTRLSVENLEYDVRRLQSSISGTSSSILKLIDEELYPQLVSLTSGLMHMWSTMYDCHQVQYRISQKLNHLVDNQSTDFTTDYHRQATAQLETEVTCWHNSFCRLMKSQREYVKTLCRWVQLTECLVDENQPSCYSSAVRRLSEEWQLVFDRLPDKAASEAIRSFLSAIQSIIQQQAEEHNLQKKSNKLEKRLQKECEALADMERKLELSFRTVDTQAALSPKHPLSIKFAKTEALKKLAESEKAKYLNSVQVTRSMTLNNLKTSLPNVFQALMAFSNAYARALEAVLGHEKPVISCDESESSTS